MQTERVTFLATPAVKQAIAARASSRGLSLGEYVRRRALDDDDLTPMQEAELSALVKEVNEAIPRLQASLARISENVRELREENDVFFKERGLAL